MKEEDFILIFLYAMAGAFLGACLFSILDSMSAPATPREKLDIRVHYPPPAYVPVPRPEPDRPA